MKGWLGFELQYRAQAFDAVDADLNFHCNIYIILKVY